MRRKQVAEALTPPSVGNLLREWRVFLEAGQTLLSWLRTERTRLPGTPVLVLPGFCTSDRSTWAMRRQLRRCGARPYGWGLGINRGPRPGVLDALGERLEQIAQLEGRPVVLVGWSLGGLLARLVASRHRGAVAEVITLGSPLTADPRATRLGGLFRVLCGEIAPAEVASMLQQADSVPVTSIYSRTDGVVAWEASAHASGKVLPLEVNSSHLGMGCNRGVLDLVVQRIAMHKRQVPARPLGGSGLAAVGC